MDLFRFNFSNLVIINIRCGRILCVICTRLCILKRRLDINSETSLNYANKITTQCWATNAVSIRTYVRQACAKQTVFLSVIDRFKINCSVMCSFIRMQENGCLELLSNVTQNFKLFSHAMQCCFVLKGCVKCGSGRFYCQRFQKPQLC